jgi:muramoyltetrapeptide carboxypeptidase
MGGGNLTVTQSHLGTKFYREPKGQIIFFEDLGERGYRVDRILKQLEMAGYFRNVAAVVFGDFTGSLEPAQAPSKVPAVLERFASSMKFPVFSGMPIGHGENQRPLPLGTSTVLNCSDGHLAVSVPTQK